MIFFSIKISELCDFGVEPNLITCDWSNRNSSQLKWELGAGVLSNWLGGPTKDAGTGDDANRGKNTVKSEMFQEGIKKK